MSSDRTAAAEHAQQLLRQISLELAFVDPHGRKPAEELRRLIRELEQVVAVHASQAIRDLAAEARARVETAPGVAAILNSDAIVHLHDWQPRIQEEVIAWSREPHAGGGQSSGNASAQTTTRITGSSPQEAAAKAASEMAETETFSVLPEDADDELVRLFCSESQDLLQDIEQGVLVLEERPEDNETLATVFRAFHTFKGNASVMKLAVIQRLAHELESLLDAARHGTFRLDRRAIDVILAGADVFRRFIGEMAAQIEGVGAGRQIRLPVASVIDDVQSLLSRGPAPAHGVAVPRAAVPTPAPAPETAVAAVSPEALIPMPAPEASAVPVATGVPAAAPAPAPPVPADAEPPSAEPAARQPAAGAGAAGLIRVDTAKLDGLIDLVGELVIAQSMVTQNADVQSVTSEQLARSLSQLRGISTELQRTALSLRMVPIRGTFQKMARLVRDLAGQVGKELRLVLEGEETELDRTLVEELGDPLVHMIRNAADHGVESPADRTAAGKPAAGTITLRAFHKGGMVFLQIADDGRGMSVSRIRAKAVERGLISANEPFSDRELLDLIFTPGFSLASTVTDLSGRGVGMDVVRRNIERLRGTIEIDSIEGRGTTFTIGLPLTLAIIEGLLVQVGDQRFVVPTLSVRESFRPLPSMLSRVQGRGEMVSVRGTLTPLLRLADHLRIPGAISDPAQGIVMVLESGQDRRCILVDSLVGKQEVVIKSLGETFQDRQEFAGAAILGDGRVGLILDTTALVRLKLTHPEAA